MRPHKAAASVSIAIHVLVILLALLIKLNARTVGPSVTLTIGPSDERMSELLKIETDVSEPTVNPPDEMAADVAIGDFSDPMFNLDIVAPNQFGSGTDAGVTSPPATSDSMDRGWNLTSYRVTAVLDASQGNSRLSDVSSERRQLVSREEIRSDVAREIARINPGEIFSVVFIPMVDDGSTLAARRHVIEWATQIRHDGTALETVSPTPDVVILASNTRYPMAELREIVGGNSDSAPMLVIGLQLERSSVGELEEIAKDCGGTYFGIER